MMNQRFLVGIAAALVCSWTMTLPLRAGKAQVHENNKPLDTKQINRLERQLSEIRQRIDQLRQVKDPHTQNIAENLARRSPTKIIVNAFHGLWYTNRGGSDDFRLSDRVLIVRRINGSKQITGYGVVVRLEWDAMLFEVLHGSSIQFEDEVYVLPANSLIGIKQKASHCNTLKPSVRQ